MTTNHENNVYSAGITDTIYGGAFADIASKLNDRHYSITVCKGAHSEPIVSVTNTFVPEIMPIIHVNARTMKDNDGLWWVLDLKFSFPDLWQEHGSDPTAVSYMLSVWDAITHIATMLNEIKIPYTD
jgi:hypothetical protein